MSWNFTPLNPAAHVSVYSVHQEKIADQPNNLSEPQKKEINTNLIYFTAAVHNLVRATVKQKNKLIILKLFVACQTKEHGIINRKLEHGAGIFFPCWIKLSYNQEIQTTARLFPFYNMVGMGIALSKFW